MEKWLSVANKNYVYLECFYYFSRHIQVQKPSDRFTFSRNIRCRVNECGLFLYTIIVWEGDIPRTLRSARCRGGAEFTFSGGRSSPVSVRPVASPFRVMSSTMSLLFILSAAVFAVAPSLAMDCSFGQSRNVVDKVINTCPRPLIDPTDKEFCCMGSDGEFYCCEGASFALFIFIAILIVLVPLMLICCVIGCVWRCICTRRTHQRVRVVY